MDFAKKQLEKYGWSEGKGLGRHEDGIAAPLRPQLKFDTGGVGLDPGEQFTNRWWERVFDSAARSISVRAGAGGVTLRRRSPLAVEASTRALPYGAFVRPAQRAEPPPAAPAPLSDEALLRACGGRTAHKGARHGLRLGGKLARVERQERALLRKMRQVSLGGQRAGARKTVTFSDEPAVRWYAPEARDDGFEEGFGGGAPADHRSFEEARPGAGRKRRAEGTATGRFLAEVRLERDKKRKLASVEESGEGQSKKERKRAKKMRKLAESLDHNCKITENQ